MNLLKSEGSRSPRWPLPRSTIRWWRRPDIASATIAMKACIYQKQEPVRHPAGRDPHAEACSAPAPPWGFEIYSLLTRWNRSTARPIPRPRRPAAACWWSGLGPAGFNPRII